MLFAEYFHKYTFYCRNTISFRFARINICCFRPAFLDCIKVDSRRFSAIQKPSLIIEPGFPAHIIEIFQDTIPFAMGIIAQAAFVGRNRLPQVVICTRAFHSYNSFSSGVPPRLRARAIQVPTLNSGRVASNSSCNRIKRRKRSEASLYNFLSPAAKAASTTFSVRRPFSGDRLADDIDQIILEIIVSLELIGYRHHHSGSTNHIVRIIIVFHLRPA